MKFSNSNEMDLINKRPKLKQNFKEDKSITENNEFKERQSTKEEINSDNDSIYSNLLLISNLKSKLIKYFRHIQKRSIKQDI